MGIAIHSREVSMLDRFLQFRRANSATSRNADRDAEILILGSILMAIGFMFR